MFSLMIWVIIIPVLYFLIRLVFTSTGNSDDLYILPLPAEKPSLIFGHELMIWKHQASELYIKWASQLGFIYKISCAFGHPDIIVVSDHAAAHHVLSLTDQYVKSPSFLPPIDCMLGRGVLWAEGDDHKKQRRLVAPAFSTEAVRDMTRDICDCAERLEKKLVDHVVNLGSGAVINVLEQTSICTLDIIGRVGFNHDFKSGQTEDAKGVHDSWGEVIQFGITYGGFLAPLIIRTFPSVASLALRSQGKVRKIVSRLSMQLIERGTLADEARDVLSMLLRANQDAKENSLTNDQLVGNITTFVLVGHETSSVVLAYTLLELARNPSKQKRLRDELRLFDREITFDNINELVYLDAVIMEGLRLHPSSPLTERAALKDDVIPLKKAIRDPQGKLVQSIRIRAGQVFYIPFKVMNVNGDVWGENALEFVPERWIAPDGIPPKAELPYGWKGIMTFADGPRNCVGYRLAVFELKIILASLVRSLEFRETDADIKNKIAQTLQPVVDGKVGIMPLFVRLAPGQEV